MKVVKEGKSMCAKSLFIEEIGLGRRCAANIGEVRSASHTPAGRVRLIGP